jgi:Ca2+-binding RTX toxin-like protein
MLGGNGGDVVVHLEAGAGDQVTVINGLPDNSLVQNNFENIDASDLDGSLTATGNADANTLIGSDFADTLNGGAGNDRLDGGAGNDVMDGGAGNDTYVVDSSTDIAAETLPGDGGVDLVQSSASSYTLGANVENLTLLGTADINGTGNSLNNILTGNSGSNSLDGGAGADKMAGGLGNDTYRVDAVGDMVTEALNAGTDNVISSVTYTLGANLENLQLISGANINGTGNTLDNVLTGSNGDNLLSGLGGNDTLRGLHGNDTLNGGSGNDTFLFGVGDGNDVIQDNSGCFDTVQFDPGISHDNLVISKLANDLQIKLQGSLDDQITVKNWFVGTTNQTEIIQAGDGQVLVNTQVQQLIDAMAQFTADNNGVTWEQAVGGAGDQAQFQGILAANWGS